MNWQLFPVSLGDGGRLFMMPAPDPSHFPAIGTAGVRTVVSLLLDDEARELGLAREEALCAAAGLDLLRLPIEDFATPPDQSATRALVAAIVERIAAGDAVAIHCRAGIGRTGMLTVAVLIGLGHGRDEAVRIATEARGRVVPETAAQREWIAAFVAKERG